MTKTNRRRVARAVSGWNPWMLIFPSSTPRKKTADDAGNDACQDEDHNNREQVWQGLDNGVNHRLKKVYQESAQPVSPRLRVRKPHQLVHQPDISQKDHGDQGEEPDSDTLEGDDVRSHIHAADR